MTARSTSRRSVTFVCGRLPEYRVPFFEQLREVLDRRDITVRVLAGVPVGRETRKLDGSTVDWVEYFEPREIRWHGRRIVWQPVFATARRSDLVIVEQASGYVVNHLFLACQLMRACNVAFWGHGFNHAPDASRIGESLKRVESRFPAWWFAYTDGVAKSVECLGYDPSHITVVQNSIDTASLRASLETLTASEVETTRRELGAGSEKIALFVGSLYEDKGLEFLLEAARAVHEVVPDFMLVVAGNGPDERVVADAAQDHPWVRWIGRRTGRELARVAALSKLILVPRAIGLVAVDSFALGLPIVTTAAPHHGPEFEYLQHGQNAWIVRDWQSPRSYADAVVRLLTDEREREGLVVRCAESAARISLDEMVRRFGEGIESAVLSRVPCGSTRRL